MSSNPLRDKVVVITGGGGLLGTKHAEAVAEADGIPVLLDIRSIRDGIFPSFVADITDENSVADALLNIIADHGKIDVLINNAANNPHVGQDSRLTRLENFSIEQWKADVDVGLTGAFLCSKFFGTHMADNGGGVIINVASDLAVIAPNQSLYHQEGLQENQQPVKPVTYSVVKTGLIGLTRYLATYWAKKGVRVNAISPGGVYNNQPQDFVDKLIKHIPLGRMADIDEYKGAIVFLCSDASRYMTGQNLIIDGGRCCW